MLLLATPQASLIFKLQVAEKRVGLRDRLKGIDIRLAEAFAVGVA